MPKPGDFFVGVLDLFAVLLPGALLTALLVAWGLDGGAAEVSALSDRVADSGTLSWLAFFVAAYLLGQFLSGLGALVLDPIYDCAYRDWWILGEGQPFVACSGTSGSSGSRMTDRRSLASGQTTSSIGPAVGVEATRVRAEQRARAVAGDARAKDDDFSTYEWAEASVRMRSADASTAVDRIQADPKFFRSFVLVIMFALAISFGGIDLVMADRFWTERVVLVLFGLLACWRFVELRLAATKVLYKSYLQPAGDA